MRITTYEDKVELNSLQKAALSITIREDFYGRAMLLYLGNEIPSGTSPFI